MKLRELKAELAKLPLEADDMDVFIGASNHLSDLPACYSYVGVAYFKDWKSTPEFTHAEVLISNSRRLYFSGKELSKYKGGKGLT